jgi:hypothetical protein
MRGKINIRSESGYTRILEKITETCMTQILVESEEFLEKKTYCEGISSLMEIQTWNLIEHSCYTDLFAGYFVTHPLTSQGCLLFAEK